MQYLPTVPYVAVPDLDVVCTAIAGIAHLLLLYTSLLTIVRKCSQPWAARRHVRNCSQRAARPDVVLSVDIAKRCKTRYPVIVESMFEAQLANGAGGVAIYVYCAYSSKGTPVEYKMYASAQLYRSLTGVGDNLPHFVGLYCLKQLTELVHCNVSHVYSVVL